MNCLLLIIAVIVLAIGIYFVSCKDWRQLIGGIFFALSGSVIFIFIMVGSLKSDTYRSFERDYKETVYTIKTYNIENDEDLYILNTVLNTVKDLNKQIENNKNRCNNLFYGYLYDKKISEFEPISTENLLKNKKEEE